MTEIIDFHTHPYLAESENSCMYKENFFLSPQQAKEDLKKTGISHFCGSVIRPGKYDGTKGFDQIRELNEQALEIKSLYDGLETPGIETHGIYTPGFHIHPAFVEESLETLDWMHEQGFRLIGELVPYMHGWSQWGLDYASDGLQRILERAGEYHMVVSYHTMTEWQEQMEVMISQNPDVIFVAAHPGEKEDYLKHLERLEKYGNAYLDLSGTGLFRYGMLKYGIERAGADKFLFGTDYPITNPGMYVEAVNFEHISGEDREKIFCENAKRLLFA